MSQKKGLYPHKFWIEDRLNDIRNVLIEHVNTTSEFIPVHWVEEYNSLLPELKKDVNGRKIK